MLLAAVGEEGDLLVGGHPLVEYSNERRLGLCRKVCTYPSSGPPVCGMA
jgi:hypothetical protein